MGKRLWGTPRPPYNQLQERGHERTSARSLRRKEILMVSFNRVVLGGNLTRDPEMRFTQAGVPVCSFGIAVNRVRSRNEEVDFFDISAWRELGDTTPPKKKKGHPIRGGGRLKYPIGEPKDAPK